MNTFRILPSERAENAIRRLMLIYASYQGWRTADLLSRPRFSRLASPDQWNALSAPAVLAQLVSIAEHFSAGLLMDNATDAIDGTPLIARDLWSRARNSVDSTWKNQRRAWKGFFEIDFGDAEYYEKLSPYIDARNSVLHGIGSLTRRQQENKEDIIRRLQSAGIRVVGNALQIRHEVVIECRDVARNFILWLDLEDQRYQLSI